MNKAFSTTVGALAVCLAAASSPAAAVVLNLPQSTRVLMNFDLTGATPGPMFDSIELSIPRSAVTGMFCQVYGEVLSSPADVATATFVNGCASSSTVVYTYADPLMLDGLFSIDFSFFGAVTLTDPYAVGIRNGVRTGLVLGTLVPGQNLPGQVGEPGTLALLGVALMATLVRRRR